MLKNNKRGFTLVELLAVIVILGVITLIAVTSVIPRMNSARKNAFLDDAKVYFKASDEIDLYNNNTTKCLDISEVNGEYVSKNDDSYSGALYVYPNGDTKLYLTNGKYYVITTGDVTTDDILDSKPANFIASCTDNSKTYTITYDLDGGTLDTANPTSYKFNTDTFKLNNPTKPGYRFVGWSSKNLLDMYNRTEDTFTSYPNTSVRIFDFKKYYVGLSPNNYYNKNNITKLSVGHVWNVETKAAGYGIGFPVKVKPNTSYRVSNPGKNYVAVGLYKANGEYVNFTAAKTTDFTVDTPDDVETISVVLRAYPANTLCKYYDIQLEEGSSSTDYQEYMDPTIDVKIYRGSTGNKKFIANWEVI